MFDAENIKPFGDVSKAATVLMEKIADSVTGLCRPWQIKRVANAEAEAKIIAKRADIEVLELEERALRRFVAEETAKQENMESIAAKSIPHLKQDANPSKMEKDWITNFMDRCRLISDDEMQEMWSKVLADEANSPGSVSKQTVNIMSQMDKNDALMFQKFASFVLWGGEPVPFILQTIGFERLWLDSGLDSMTKWHLQNLGLVDVCQSLGGFTVNDMKVNPELTYFNETISVISVDPKLNGNIPIGVVDFTRPGIQLFRICSPLKIEGFCEEVVKYWTEAGITCLTEQAQATSTPPPNRPS